MIGKLKLQKIYCHFYLKDEHYFESESLQKPVQILLILNYSGEENFKHRNKYMQWQTVVVGLLSKDRTSVVCAKLLQLGIDSHHRLLTVQRKR